MTEALNTLAAYLARRDVEALTPTALSQPADVLLLAGNCLLRSLELAAQALEDGLVERILITGGIGHSTNYLRTNVANHPDYHSVAVEGRAEADIFFDILVGHFDIPPEHILVENQSTNCGANAQLSKELLDAKGIIAKRILLIQDPTMQRRTHASCERSWQGTGTEVISFAPFIPFVYEKKSRSIIVEGEGEGVWDFARFLSLVQGEIPRLLDNEDGYGPKGKNFIDHIDIPADVLEAYYEVAAQSKTTTRPA